MLNSMPYTAAPRATQGGNAGTAMPDDLCERLEELLGVPPELFLGVPGESAEEREARQAAAADILSVEPLLAIAAHQVAQVVHDAYVGGADIVEFRGGEPEYEVVEMVLAHGPLGPDTVKVVA